MADNDGFGYMDNEGGHRPRDVIDANERSFAGERNDGIGIGNDRKGDEWKRRRDRDGSSDGNLDHGGGNRRDRERRRSSRDRRERDGGSESDRDYDRDKRDKDRGRYDRDLSDSDRDGGGGKGRRGSRDRDRRARNRDYRNRDGDRDSRYSDRSRDRYGGRDRDRDRRYAGYDDDDDDDDDDARDIRDKYPGRLKDRDMKRRDRSKDSYRDRDGSPNNEDMEPYAQVKKREKRDDERGTEHEPEAGRKNERDDQRNNREGEQDSERVPRHYRQSDTLDSRGERYQELYVGDHDPDYARLGRGSNSNYDQDYPNEHRGRYEPRNGSVSNIPNLDYDSRQHPEGLYDFPRGDQKKKKDWKMILSPAALMAKLRKKKGDESNETKPDPMMRPPEHHANATGGKESAPKGEDDEKKLVYGEDENEERGNWTGRYDFILSLLGTAVGLGNVWRFPYLCYRNGGGAFLFPFLIMMVVIGVPLFFLEAALGQFSSCGAMTCWDFAPFFKGVGVAMVMISALTGIYYNMILGWSLHYLFASFTDELPWTTCQNEWNTKDCNQLLPEMSCTKEDQSRSQDGLCTSDSGKEVGLWNLTLFELSGRKLASASEQYWDNHVLDFSHTIDDFGVPKWDLVLCLLLAWVICFFCLIKGIKTTGKVVYFTAIFPYVVLTILFFRGVTLDNAGEGIEYFITPKFEKLLDANVWKDAANQIFFSMSIAGGGLITLSSYNRFHNNILRDSMIVAIGDSFTCVFGGFVIFSFLGYMAGQLDVGIEDVAADGAGLAFVVYPEAVSSLPPAPLWSVLFFFMLLTLGLDSQFAMLETVLTGVLDQYPALRPKKTLVILCICCILFILGLPLTCPGGMYLLQILDNYVGGMSLIILGFVELVAIVFIYGVNRFLLDIQLMIGEFRVVYWKATWCVLSPLIVVFIFVFMFVDYKRSTYGEDYTFPVWADVFGWLVTASVVICIPVNMLIKIAREKDEGSLCSRIQALCLPTLYWGPALPKHRRLVDYVDSFRIDPWQDIKPRHAYSNPAFSNKPSDTSDSIRATPAPSHTSISMYPSGTPNNPSTPTSGRRKSREFQYTGRLRDPYPSRRHQHSDKQHGDQTGESPSSNYPTSQPRDSYLERDELSKDLHEPRHYQRHQREPHSSRYEPRHEPHISSHSQDDIDYHHNLDSHFHPIDRSYTTGSAISIAMDAVQTKNNSSFETVV